MFDRSDEETGELVKEWLQRYGVFLIILIILMIGGISGYRWWQNQQDRERSEQAGYLTTLYQAIEAHKVSEAKQAFEKIQPKGELFAFGNLLMARLAYQDHDQQAALNYLTVASQSKDNAVSSLALWQRAKIYVAMGNDALASQDLQVLKGTMFSQNIAELTGIAQQKKGNLLAAAKSYQQVKVPGIAALFARQSGIIQAALALDTQHAKQGSTTSGGQ